MGSKFSKDSISERVKWQLNTLLHRIARYLAHKPEHVGSIYKEFDSLFKMMEELRSSDDWIRSVISRSYQYVRFMMNDFERLRVIYDFYMPSSFRSFLLMYILLFPVLFAPLFANIAHLYGLWAGIFVVSCAQ